MDIVKINELMSDTKTVRFIGIGGISMSALAMIAKKRNYVVTGYDRSSTDVTKSLEKQGIVIDYDPNEGSVDEADVIVYTAAMKSDFPELVRADELGKPLIKRAEFLGYIMQEYKNRIGVAGMHGKSTTTSMLAQAFMSADTDPTVVNGAILNILENGNYRVGGHEHFIFEACEYTDSFLSFFPSIAIVLNIDREHVDYFKSIEQTIESFAKYISLADTAVVNWDDQNTRRACEGYKGRLIKCGFDSDNLDYCAKNVNHDHGKGNFDVYKGEKFLGHIQLKVPGKHNVFDALVAVACADYLNVDIEKAIEGLNEFTGARRRFEYVGTCNGAVIYDDYAHHPSEIKATLAGAAAGGYNRVFCVFQPHTYSRLAELFDEFARAFDQIDYVIFADVYAAREVNVYGISSEALAQAAGNDALYFPTFEEIAQYLRDNLGEGDLVITMGAGNVNEIGNMIKDCCD